MNQSGRPIGMNKIDQINQTQIEASVLRDQLKIRADRFIRLHGERPGSDEAKALRAVILEGAAYQDAMDYIAELRRKRNNLGS